MRNGLEVNFKTVHALPPRPLKPRPDGPEHFMLVLVAESTMRSGFCWRKKTSLYAPRGRLLSKMSATCSPRQHSKNRSASWLLRSIGLSGLETASSLCRGIPKKSNNIDRSDQTDFRKAKMMSRSDQGIRLAAKASSVGCKCTEWMMATVSESRLPACEQACWQKIALPQ